MASDLQGDDPEAPIDDNREKWGFEIDQQRGLIKFSEPVLRMETAPDR